MRALGAGLALLMRRRSGERLQVQPRFGAPRSSIAGDQRLRFAVGVVGISRPDRRICAASGNSQLDSSRSNLRFLVIHPRVEMNRSLLGCQLDIDSMFQKVVLAVQRHFILEKKEELPKGAGGDDALFRIWPSSRRSAPCCPFSRVTLLPVPLPVCAPSSCRRAGRRVKRILVAIAIGA